MMEIGGTSVQGEEFLSSLSSFKPKLAAFLLPGWSMRLFDEIVAARAR